MGKFDLQIEKNGNDWKIRMSGTVDEDVDFGQYSLTGAGSIELFLGEVKSINSCGIREWIKWIGTAGGVPISYNECPKIIVDQINMVQGFLPAQGRVNSFYVPYYNEESGSEKNVLFKLGSEFTETGEIKAPMVKDDEGHEMEMDVVGAKYFKFLKK